MTFDDFKFYANMAFGLTLALLATVATIAAFATGFYFLVQS